MKLILFILSSGVAFSVGAAIINMPWLLAVFCLDNVRAIFSESDKAPDGDYRQLSGNQFSKSEHNIKMKLTKSIFVSAIIFGLGYLYQTI